MFQDGSILSPRVVVGTNIISPECIRREAQTDSGLVLLPVANKPEEFVDAVSALLVPVRNG